MATKKKSLIGAVKTTKKGKVASASAGKGISASIKSAPASGVKHVALGRQF